MTMKNILTVAALLVFAGCLTPADGPHELVVVISGSNGPATMRAENVVGAFVSRESCMNAAEKMLAEEMPQAKNIARTSDSRTDNAEQYTLTSTFRCRLNMAAKPTVFVEKNAAAVAAERKAAEAAEAVRAEERERERESREKRDAVERHNTTPSTTSDPAAERVFQELQRLSK